MNFKVATKQDEQTVIQFYYQVIDAMQGSPYNPWWEKDIYPSNQQLIQAIDKQSLYLLQKDTTCMASVVLNHDCNAGYNSVDWQVKTAPEHVFYVHLLGVNPSMHGQGIGKKLIAHIIELAKLKGIQSIRLDVLPHNIPAQKLYESMGFKKRASIKMFYEDTGWTDFLLYEYHF